MAEKLTAAEKAAQDAAERAAAAAEVADAADLKAKREAAEEEGNKVCPNCRGELVKHDAGNPHKVGAWHCDSCGSCLVWQGSTWVPRT